MDGEFERISQKETSKAVGKLGGGFLLTKLQINYLKAYEDEELRGQLDDFPESLKDVFARSMEHIEKPDQVACVTGKRALLRAIYAKRPLTLLELSEALATYRYLALGYVPAVIQRRDRLSAIQLVEATGYFLHIEESTQIIQSITSFEILAGIQKQGRTTLVMRYLK